MEISCTFSTEVAGVRVKMLLLSTCNAIYKFLRKDCFANTDKPCH